LKLTSPQSVGKRSVVSPSQFTHLTLKGILGFLAVFLSITGAGTYYIWRRAVQSFSLSASAEWIVGSILGFLLVSYILAVVIERKTEIHWLSDTLTWIGSIWIFVLTWFFLAVVTVDLVRLADLAFGFLPDSSSAEYAQLRLSAGWITVGVVFGGFIFGHLNARYVRVKPMVLDVNKRSPHESLTIVTASDLHLGVINGKRRTRIYVDKINAQDPDIVLLAGDVVDGALAPVKRRELGKILAQIKSRYGVYAVTGNHEYIGTVEASVHYLEAHGITMLRDAVLEVEGMYIAGREDLSYNRASARQRKTVAELLAEVDHSKPIILMDHQPFHLEQAEEAGVDLQISGHTHHGQFFPINLITNRVYEVSWGYKKKSNTHVYVSCGAGTWGPPVRIGSMPEIMRFEMRFSA
jgi:predicted MPP superfamily phosphohydrolase